MYMKDLTLLIRSISDSILGFLVLIFLVVSSAKQHIQVIATNPPRAYGSRCVYVDYTIYCYGGSQSYLDDYNVDLQGTQQFFSLNVSGPINAIDNASSWRMIDLRDQDTRPEPNMFFFMDAMDTPEHKLFVISGGAGLSFGGPALRNPLMYYDVKTEQWNSIDSSKNRTQRVFGSMIYDKAGDGDRFFVWGGDRSMYYIGYQDGTSIDMNMSILTYDDWNWTSPTNDLPVDSHYAIRPRTQHAAAQGGDGRIYITGGLQSSENTRDIGENSTIGLLVSASMAETLVYDVNTGWSVKPTIGDIPSRRMYHTMVPTSDGKSFICYGGSDTSPILSRDHLPVPNPVRDVAYILDVSNPERLVWKNVTDILVKNTGLSAWNSGRYLRFLHSSILLRNQSLFVLFGANNQDVQTDFFIIDTTTWNLTNSFDWTTDTNSHSDNDDDDDKKPTSNSISGGAIAGIVIGSLAAVAIIIGAVLFFIHRKRKANMHRHVPNVITDGYNDSNHQSPHTSSAMTLTLNRTYNTHENGHVSAIKPYSDTQIKIMAVKPDGE